MTPSSPDNSAREAARGLLADLTSADIAGEWSAPGRANLIGEHTDYNEGFVLPFAIERRTSAAVALRSDHAICVATTFADGAIDVQLTDLDALFGQGAPTGRESEGGVPEWATYPLGVAWALIEQSGADAASLRGVDIAIASDVPVGAGLSSSAAIEGAVATALNDVWGLGLDASTLARIGQIAENTAVGAPTGIMDQMASMRGRADAALFLDCRTLEARNVELGLRANGLRLVVIDTRVSHSHSTGGYRARRDSCERGAAAMEVPALRDVTVADLARAQELLDDETFRRVRHIVTENQRVLDTVAVLESEGPLAIGDLLLASHASMRDDFEISVPELDTAVEAAMSAGAIGARMTGGGFGGAAIALVPEDLVGAVTDAAISAFAERGYRAPHIFTVTPSDGAGRDA